MVSISMRERSIVAGARTRTVLGFSDQSEHPPLMNYGRQLRRRDRFILSPSVNCDKLREDSPSKSLCTTTDPCKGARGWRCSP
jgi:hypothetical protein